MNRYLNKGQAVVYSFAANPRFANGQGIIVHPIKLELDWPKLRRDLEEVLAIINGHPQFTRHPDAPFESISAKQEITLHYETHTPESGKPSAADEINQIDQTDDLFNDALLVLTEFGQASPEILQMWLSIDYSRSMTIMDRFEKEGLISSRGRVKHKAFLLRRSLDPQPD